MSFTVHLVFISTWNFVMQIQHEIFRLNIFAQKKLAESFGSQMPKFHAERIGISADRCIKPYCQDSMRMIFFISGQHQNSCGCINGGVCSDLTLGLRHCLCPSGFHGIRCERPSCVQECLNGGNCTGEKLHNSSNYDNAEIIQQRAQHVVTF